MPACPLERATNPEQRQTEARPKKKKSVTWNNHTLEQVKYFKQNDEPSAPGLSILEVQEIQKRLADVPSHMIPSELSRIEMKLDRKLLEEQKSIETQLRSKLESMKPLVRYTRQLMRKLNLTPYAIVAVATCQNFVEQRQNEAKSQRTREADKFSYYPNGQ